MSTTPAGRPCRRRLEPTSVAASCRPTTLALRPLRSCRRLRAARLSSHESSRERRGRPAIGEEEDGLQRALMDPLSRGRGTADAGGSRARRRSLPRWLLWRVRCRGHARHGRRSSSQRATAGAAAVPPTRSSRVPGSDVLPYVPGAVGTVPPRGARGSAGTTFRPISATPAATGRSIKKIARQSATWVRTPPSRTPTAAPAPPTAPQAPSARARSVPRKLVVMIESDAGDSIGAPTPWPARAANSAVELTARADASDAAVKTVSRRRRRADHRAGRRRARRAGAGGRRAASSR